MFARAFVIAWSVFQVIIALNAELGVDATAYYHAAERIRDGLPLYVTPSPGAPDDAYRYAPWWAAVWVPLTCLPEPTVYVGWMTLLLGVTAWVCWQVWRLGFEGRLLVVLLGPFLLQTSIVGNAQPLVVALLMGAGLRWGPVAVAIAASWKLTPLAAVAVYAGRREWRRAFIALGLTALFWAPALVIGLDGYPREGAGGDPSPFPLPIALGLAGLLTIAAWRYARTRYAFLIASVAMIIGLPRMHDYNATFTLTGLRQ